MKQLTISVPDKKLQFVTELLSNFRFVKIGRQVNNFVITEEQKALVNEEFRKMDENPDYAIDWEVAQHLLKID